MKPQIELHTQISTLCEHSSLFLEDSDEPKYIHWKVDGICICSYNIITLTSSHSRGVHLYGKKHYRIPFELHSIICNITDFKTKCISSKTNKNTQQPHTCMKLNFTNDSLYQAQTNGIPSQKKISGCKKRTKFLVFLKLTQQDS